MALDQGYDLSDRLDAHVRRFEWDEARVTLRTLYFSFHTLYFSLLIGGVLFLSSLEERTSGDEGSLGVLLAVALGGGFICAFTATVTKTPRACSTDSAPVES